VARQHADGSHGGGVRGRRVRRVGVAGRRARHGSAVLRSHHRVPAAAPHTVGVRHSIRRDDLVPRRRRPRQASRRRGDRPRVGRVTAADCRGRPDRGDVDVQLVIRCAAGLLRPAHGAHTLAAQHRAGPAGVEPLRPPCEGTGNDRPGRARRRHLLRLGAGDRRRSQPRRWRDPLVDHVPADADAIIELLVRDQGAPRHVVAFAGRCHPSQRHHGSARVRAPDGLRPAHRSRLVERPAPQGAVLVPVLHGCRRRSRVRAGRPTRSARRRDRLARVDRSRRGASALAGTRGDTRSRRGRPDRRVRVRSDRRLHPNAAALGRQHAGAVAASGQRTARAHWRHYVGRWRAASHDTRAHHGALSLRGSARPPAGAHRRVAGRPTPAPRGR